MPGARWTAEGRWNKGRAVINHTQRICCTNCFHAVISARGLDSKLRFGEVISGVLIDVACLILC
jgi:hypothetical protein